jgi:hypothetical protein
MPYVPGGGKISDVYHATNVYANGQAVALWNPPGGAAAYMAKLGLALDLTFVDNEESQYVADSVDADDIDFDDPTTTSKVDTAIAAGQASGKITANTVPATAPIVTQTDTGSPNTSAGTVIAGDFASYTESEYPKGHSIYSSLQLTANTSLAKFTTQTALWNGGDPKWLKAQKGLTVPQILNNMANLAKNTWEPIYAKYPNAIITNVFRQGASQAQHGDGMAMDIQFKGIAPSDYFTIAQWIRDNIPFDQLLLEKAANAPWIHISFWSGTGKRVSDKPINRVATVIVSSPSSFTPGLQQVA